MNTRPDGNDNIFALREESIRKIRQAVDEGLSFDQACSLILIENRELREAVVSESLKTLITELHVFKGMPLKQLAMKLRLSMSRLAKAKENMDNDPEEARVIRNKASIAGRQDIN